MSKQILLQTTTLITWAKRLRILDVTHIILVTSRSSFRGSEIHFGDFMYSIQLNRISSIFFLRFDCFFGPIYITIVILWIRPSNHWENWVHLSAHAIFPQKLAKDVVVLFVCSLIYIKMWTVCKSCPSLYEMMMENNYFFS